MVMSLFVLLESFPLEQLTHENEKISTFPNFPFFGTLVRKSQPFIHNAFWVRWFVYGKRKQTPSTRATN